MAGPLGCDPQRLIGRMLPVLAFPVAWARVSPRQSVELIRLWSVIGCLVVLASATLAVFSFCADGDQLGRHMEDGRGGPRKRNFLVLFAVFKILMGPLPFLGIYFLTVLDHPDVLSGGEPIETAVEGFGRWGIVVSAYILVCMKACDYVSWIVLQATRVLPQGATIRTLNPVWWGWTVGVGAITWFFGFLTATNVLTVRVGARSPLIIALVSLSLNIAYGFVFHQFLRGAYRSAQWVLPLRVAATRPRSQSEHQRARVGCISEKPERARQSATRSTLKAKEVTVSLFRETRS
jgi:hypothetical protein